MTDTLTPHEAARVLARASTYEAGLQQRTEGLTHMVWALVGPGIFLTYAYAEGVEGFPGWGWSLLWVPWVMAGSLVTFALWRSAGLSMPHVPDPIGPMGYLLRTVVASLVVAAVFALWDPRHHAAPLLVIGGMHLVFALVNAWRTSPRGRRVGAAVGAVLLAAAALLVSLPETPAGFAGTVLAAGLAPLLAGLWQTLRG